MSMSPMPDTGRRPVRAACRAVAASWLLVGLFATASSAQDHAIQVPDALKPIEHLTGTWKGVGIPTVNKLKGWQETHVFGWVFEKGEPVAMAIELKGSKLLARGKIRPAEKGFVLEGVDPDDKKVRWVGQFDEEAHLPTILFTPDPPAEKGPARRLVVRLLSNKEGYTFWDEKKTGSRYTRVVEVRMSRNDPAVAASGSGSGKPKCIITGGEGTMTVSFQGKSYPVCCSGCREEFLADPEKYLAKLAKAKEVK